MGRELPDPELGFACTLVCPPLPVVGVVPPIPPVPPTCAIRLPVEIIPRRRSGAKYFIFSYLSVTELVIIMSRFRDFHRELFPSKPLRRQRRANREYQDQR